MKNIPFNGPDYDHIKVVPGEVLNIHYHKQRLLVAALNKADKIKDAAKLLGISEKGIYNLIKQHYIFYNHSANLWECMPKKVHKVKILEYEI